ncbi:MAG: LOW QUALITY PROTEIN: uncharacterized protein KVP18_004206 [Porospora cf. gigantea A]|uniref:uncharacterized protein n=1 Tax=Porospora cf. gigantea A TaxID=2853593 RepID=UPI00355A7A16|nr:MAG: LOW QUALITY PROTEIN: hypothetical protein KVP18_004206 [Porospora cf. gigantea A]
MRESLPHLGVSDRVKLPFVSSSSVDCHLQVSVIRAVGDFADDHGLQVTVTYTASEESPGGRLLSSLSDTELSTSVEVPSRVSDRRTRTEFSPVPLTQPLPLSWVGPRDYLQLALHGRDSRCLGACESCSGCCRQRRVQGRLHGTGTQPIFELSTGVLNAGMQVVVLFPPKQRDLDGTTFEKERTTRLEHLRDLVTKLETLTNEETVHVAAARSCLESAVDVAEARLLNVPLSYVPCSCAGPSSAILYLSVMPSLRKTNTRVFSDSSLSHATVPLYMARGVSPDPQPLPTGPKIANLKVGQVRHARGGLLSSHEIYEDSDDDQAAVLKPSFPPEVLWDLGMHVGTVGMCASELLAWRAVEEAKAPIAGKRASPSLKEIKQLRQLAASVHPGVGYMTAKEQSAFWTHRWYVLRRWPSTLPKLLLLCSWKDPVERRSVLRILDVVAPASSLWTVLPLLFPCFYISASDHPDASETAAYLRSWTVKQLLSLSTAANAAFWVDLLVCVPQLVACLHTETDYRRKPLAEFLFSMAIDNQAQDRDRVWHARFVDRLFWALVVQQHVCPVSTLLLFRLLSKEYPFSQGSIDNSRDMADTDVVSLEHTTRTRALASHEEPLKRQMAFIETVRFIAEGILDPSKIAFLITSYNGSVAALMQLFSFLTSTSDRRTQLLRELLQSIHSRLEHGPVEGHPYLLDLLDVQPPIRLPLDSELEVVGVDVEKSFVMRSSRYPLVLGCTLKDGSAYRILYKRGDDLRQDALMSQVVQVVAHDIRGMEWEPHVTRYNVLPLSTSDGLVEFLANVTPMSDTRRGSPGGLRESMVSVPSFPSAGPSPLPRSASEPDVDCFSRHHNLLLMPDIADDIRPEVLEKFIVSAATYSTLTYILGVGDRHLDNILITADWKMLHVDFGYLWGDDPKPFPPPMRICKEMLAVMGGQESAGFQRFTACMRVFYRLLRQGPASKILLLPVPVCVGLPSVLRKVPGPRNYTDSREKDITF